MTDYTDEELNRIIAEKVAAAQNAQFVADNGVTAFVMSIEYLHDQASRKVIPMSVCTVMEQVYQEFRFDMGLDPRPHQVAKQPEKTPEPDNTED